jgi:hypothetical protein
MPDAAPSAAPPTISFRGVPVVAERPRGYIQEGVDAQGRPWARVYGYDRRDGTAVPGFITYGFVVGTTSEDGEALDAYVLSGLDGEVVYVCEQGEPDPELKLVFGARDAGEAERVFCAHVPEEMLVSVRAVPLALVQALLGVSEGEVAEKAARSPSPEDVRRALRRSHAAAALCKAAAGDALRGDAPVPADHPAATQPLSGAYAGVPGPDGWLGWVEPEPRPATNPRAPDHGPHVGAQNVDSRGDWVAFVRADGAGLLWERRMGGTGEVLGDPVAFKRAPDALARDRVAAVQATLEEYPEDVAAVLARLAAAHPPAEPRPPSAEARFVSKSAADRYVLAVVLEPLSHVAGEADTQGDFYSAERIREGQRYWTRNFRNVLLHHSRAGGVVVNDKVEVADNFAAPVDMVLAGSNVRAGTWLLGIYFLDDALWGMVERGEIMSVSIEGLAERVPVAEVSAGTRSA